MKVKSRYKCSIPNELTGPEVTQFKQLCLRYSHTIKRTKEHYLKREATKQQKTVATIAAANFTTLITTTEMQWIRIEMFNIPFSIFLTALTLRLSLFLFFRFNIVILVLFP